MPEEQKPSRESVDAIDPFDHRHADHPIDDRFLGRWSPRAFSGEGISQDTLDRLLEAARWAPSSYNGQPWRFVYAHRDTPAWDRLFGFLVEFNQGWADDAAVLLVLLSRKTFEHNGAPAVTHSFDSGAAWMSLALQARELGLYAHAMQGFDAEAACDALGVEDPFTVEVMIAVGHGGDKGELPEEMRKREIPNGRKPLAEIVFEGTFPASAGDDGAGEG
jgi:nitroreductase